MARQRAWSILASDLVASLYDDDVFPAADPTVSGSLSLLVGASFNIVGSISTYGSAGVTLAPVGVGAQAVVAIRLDGGATLGASLEAVAASPVAGAFGVTLAPAGLLAAAQNISPPAVAVVALTLAAPALVGDVRLEVAGATDVALPSPALVAAGLLDITATATLASRADIEAGATSGVTGGATVTITPAALRARMRARPPAEILVKPSRLVAAPRRVRMVVVSRRRSRMVAAPARPRLLVAPSRNRTVAAPPRVRMLAAGS